LIAGDNTDLFSVQVIHNGFFCNLTSEVEYISSSVDFFDNCYAGTWSMSVLDEILFMLGCQRDSKLHLYWCLPGKVINDGLVCVESNADCASMASASKYEKTLLLFIDHTNFLRELRDDVIIKGGTTFPSVITPMNNAERGTSKDCVASSSPLFVSQQRNSQKGHGEDEVFASEQNNS
jgi:hypothetical protein